jgi:hypothetical protein
MYSTVSQRAKELGGMMTYEVVAVVAGVHLDHQVVGEVLGVDDGDAAGAGRGREDLEDGPDADVVPVAEETP